MCALSTLHSPIFIRRTVSFATLQSFIWISWVRQSFIFFQLSPPHIPGDGFFLANQRISPNSKSWGQMWIPHFVHRCRLHLFWRWDAPVKSGLVKSSGFLRSHFYGPISVWRLANSWARENTMVFLRGKNTSSKHPWKRTNSSPKRWPFQ